MIEEIYVSFDTAKMLKKAGFNITIRSHYTQSGSKWETVVPESVEDRNGIVWFPRPTQALAARWLREKHNLHIWCELTQYVDWFYCIDKIKPYKQYVAVSEADFRSFEAAFEAGLQEAVKLIKK